MLLDTGSQGLGFETRSRLGGIARQVAEGLWRGRGCRRRHVRKHPWHGGTKTNSAMKRGRQIGTTYIFLLLVYMANLEPDVGVGDGAWRIPEKPEYSVEAVQRVVILALLLLKVAQGG